MIRRRKKADMRVPTSSMGDIAFLLIIFFLLTSKFMQESHVKYETAKSPDIETVKDTNISVIVDENNTIWLQGEECASADDLKSRIETLKLDMKDDKSAVVMLKVHRRALHEVYGNVVMKLSEAGVKISFIGDRALDYNN